MIVPLLVTAMQKTPEPILMIPREIGPKTEITGGKVQEIKVDDNSIQLFVPESYKKGQNTEIWCHFHSPAWYVVGEYQRLGNWNKPIMVFNLGQGSSTYAKPFLKKGSFAKYLTQAQEILELNPSQISLNFTSFSAGYGAVRELIQDKPVLEKLKTVILNDSLYASLDPNKPNRRVREDQLIVWSPLVRKAVSGECQLLMTTSQITPETYAGTWEVAQQLIENYNWKMTTPNPENQAATNKNLAQPLLRTFKKGDWQVWSYDGETAEAHMTHARRLAECLYVLGKYE